MKAIINCDIYTGKEIVTDKAMVIDNGYVTGLFSTEALPDSIEVVDVMGATIAPGYIDLQANGGGGVLFSEVPTIEGLQTIVEAHARLGTTSLLPTVITADQSTLESAIEAVRTALANRMPGIIGIHLEGPTLNPERAGVHDRSLMRSLDPAWLIPALRGIPALVTLAPEMIDSSYIRRLTDDGIRVAIGHSNANGDQVERAAEAGASLVTHIFNACSGLTAREPGVVGVGLARRDLHVSCIVDGHHVAYRSVEVAIRAKSAGRFMLVTDAMPVVGSSSTEFTIGELQIRVRNGRCETRDGILAGSALTMAEAVKNCVQHVGVPKDEALRMATLYPAQYLALKGVAGTISIGSPANVLVLDNELNVRDVLIEGTSAADSASFVRGG
jgi:N-acetylglucosamine-6-phosphate deacetylase